MINVEKIQAYIVGYGAITNHFGNTTLCKEDLGQKEFMENLFLFVAKGYMPISIVEN